ncbi:MAG: glutamate--tRNA ligase [Candidatus Nealsonbacteria bacterium]
MKDKKEIKEIITRFAPSPTGYFHIGSARTALFNYLFTKNNNGKFILRIEDTDKERSKPEFEKDIIENLKWLGIEWDGDIYKQSQRKDTYKKYLKKLLEEDKAYYCFCTKEEIEAKRQEHMSRGLAPKYNGKCAKLSKKEIDENLKQKKKFIIRFKTLKKKVKFNDLIRGKIEFDSELIGDFTIAKDFDSPLYNFAVIVDDFELKINHIIRGEDLLPNTPKQILLQEALGFPKLEYGHLPIILGTDKSKLSKRDGATSLTEYREQGYLKEALINFLAFLGWNPGTEKEIFSMPALIKEFSLKKVQKSGAIFNIEKLNYLNGFYIRQKSIKKLTELCIPYLIEKELILPALQTQERFPNLTGYMGKEIVQKYIIKETKEEVDIGYLEKTISIYQERLKKLSEISEFIDFFFKKNLDYEKDLLRWKEAGDNDIKNILDNLISILSKIKEGDWNKENLEKILLLEAEKIEIGKAGDRGYLLWPMRTALTGKKSSAGPFEIAEILGKNKTIKRIERAMNK